MDRASVLEIIIAYIKKTHPELDAIQDQSVSNVLTTSFDVIEFLMHLEDELQLDEEIDLEALGPKFAQRMTFSELANEVVSHLTPNG